MVSRQTTEQAYTLIVGLGSTGLSVVRYLHALGERIIVADNIEQPSGKKILDQQYPDVELRSGKFDQELFTSARRIVVSPGIPMSEPVLQSAREKGIEITGDIDLFAREVNAPVVGVTGSNGKSTVTALVTAMAEQAKINVAMGGNIGTPALELLDESRDLYVLELSSFQLEALQRLPMKVAVVLNISADHLDRYQDLNSYALSKQAIYDHAKMLVVNRDDPLAGQNLPVREQITGFTLGEPQEKDFGVRFIDDEPWLCFGARQLLSASSLKIRGQHNLANALAALAIGQLLGFAMSAMLESLVKFTGLPHRTQWIAEINGVNWFNDSKATNVGAAIAAIEGLPGKHVLIAGGVGKGADFTLLRAVAEKHLCAVVLLGQQSNNIKYALAEVVPVYYADDMADAVSKARGLAGPGDNVLLSPACASFDMFKNFEHRGEVFMQAVKELGR